MRVAVAIAENGKTSRRRSRLPGRRGGQLPVDRPRPGRCAAAGARTSAADAIDYVRRLVDALCPPALDELGLVGALRRHVDQFDSERPVVAVHAPEALPPLPAAVEVAAYRIAVEALTNAVRHAGANRVEVHLSCTPTPACGLLLVVTMTGPATAAGSRALASPRCGSGLPSWAAPCPRARPTAAGGYRRGWRCERDTTRAGRPRRRSPRGPRRAVCAARVGARDRGRRHRRTGREAARAAVTEAPDVLVLDVQMLDLGGVAAITEIVRAAPAVAVLMLTMFDDDDSVLAAMRAGARGYLLKGATQEEIVRAVHAVAAGEAIFGPGIARRVLQRCPAPADPPTPSRS